LGESVLFACRGRPVGHAKGGGGGGDAGRRELLRIEVLKTEVMIGLKDFTE